MFDGILPLNLYIQHGCSPLIQCLSKTKWARKSLFIPKFGMIIEALPSYRDWLLFLKLIFYKVTKSCTNSKMITAKNTVVSPNFLVWKFCRKAQFLHSIGRIARNYAEIVPFCKISTPGNQVILQYFLQWTLIHFFLMFPFDPPKNIGQPKVF